MRNNALRFSIGAVLTFGLILGGCAAGDENRLSQIKKNDPVEYDPLKTIPVEPVSGKYGKYLQARHAEAIADYFTAAQIQHNIWKTETRNGTIGYSALRNAMRSGQIQMAIAIAHRLREDAVQPISPNNQNAASLVLAMEHMKKGRYSAAIREAQNTVVPVGIAQYAQPIFIAWGHAAVGNFSEAYAILNKELSENAMHNVYLLNMVYMDILGQNFARAEKNINTLRTSLEQPPKNVIQLYAATLYWQHGEAVARSFIRTIDKEEWREELEEKLQESSHFSLEDIHLYDAAAGLALGMNEISRLMVYEAKQLALFYAYISAYLSPANETAHYIIGDVLFTLERYEDSLRVLGKINNARSPLYRKAQALAAESEQKIGQHDKAIARLELAIARFPEDESLIFELSQIHHYREDYENAVIALTRSIEGYPKKPRWIDYYFRGIAYERTQRWELAEKDFLSALAIDPDNPYALNYLGYSWIEQRKNIQRAFKMLKKAVSLDPDNAFVVDSLGWAFYRMQNFKEAVIHLERAVEMEPAEAVINDHLGDVYWHLGRKLEARYQWERSLTLELETDQQRADVEAKLAGTLEPQP